MRTRFVFYKALMRVSPPDVNGEYINRRGGWAKALG